MNAPLYTMEILRLAATVPFQERLADPMGTSEKRSPVCGSRITVDVNLEDGRVSALGLLVRACALGQASAGILAAHVIGRTADEIAEARDQLAAWLAGEGPAPAWPGLDIFGAALPHRGRHASIRLAFEAAADAAQQAGR
ncbi:MAG: iron-sulfur cluster assembly scaffold protein [Sphingomonadales bacterium]|nr:MAG: iron-sulfur cluster assembly scaffold protein [Sphingomonadales bacterium]